VAFFIVIHLYIMSGIQKLTTKELARQWKDVSDPGFGWALYRFPGTSSVYFISGKTTEQSFNNESISGFCMAPFFSPANRFHCIENRIHFELSDADYANLAKVLNFSYPDKQDNFSSTRAGYINLVQQVLADIAAGNMQKAVPARVKQIDLKPGFSPFDLFHSLSEAYPNAFVYLISTPQTGTWIGSTPETLARIFNNKLNTISLAGTRISHAGGDNGFTVKEDAEQAIVTGYIQNILQQYCTDIEVDGPKTISAGNVFHLATYFSGNLKPAYLSSFFQIINAIHPTPAVCGMPLLTSREFLLQHEDFDRSYYSGFLGPVTETSADLFVNLRCMQVFSGSALLYAGAGVVPGSVPEKEWQETEEKMNTLQRFL